MLSTGENDTLTLQGVVFPLVPNISEVSITCIHTHANSFTELSHIPVYGVLW
jgi:phage protein U